MFAAAFVAGLSPTAITEMEATLWADWESWLAGVARGQEIRSTRAQ